MVLSDDHDLAGGQFATEDTSRLEAVHAGHVDVHEDNIGTKHPRLLKRLDAVAGLAAHMPTGLVLDEIPQSPAKQLMVVGNQDFHDVIQKVLSPSAIGSRRIYGKSRSGQTGIMQRGTKRQPTAFHALSSSYRACWLAA